MARGGYRTLLISDRELGRDEYEKWQVAYLAASVSHPACGQAAPVGRLVCLYGMRSLVHSIGPWGNAAVLGGDTFLEAMLGAACVERVQHGWQHGVA